MTKVEWLDDDQQRVWRAWPRATHHIQSYLDTGLRLVGLDLAGYEILVTLSEASGQRLRINELAHAVSQSHSRLTHIAERLEARGHTERTNCADDGQGALALLMTKDMSSLTQVAPGHVAVVRQIPIDAIEPENLEALGRVCDATLTVPGYDEHL